MSAEDRLRWDEVYLKRGDAGEEPAAPGDFRAVADQFPTVGRALDIACGTGVAAVWLALRGLQVRGLDISSVAIEHARDRAERWQVSDRCRFDVVDLDDGLPPGPPVDVLVCHRFRAPHLNPAIVERLASGGLLAISVLSEVDAAPGRYRALPGELPSAFSTLTPIFSGERHGVAWLLARKI